jgi:glycosyltransferase involved in cell wall biosynthesis
MFRVWDVFRAWRGNFDVVFLERELFSTDFVFLERILRRVARTLVLDVDDALFELHPQKFATLVRLSDCVITGNRLLHERVAAEHPFTVEIPTVVDLERYVPGPAHASRSGRPVIGWTGLASNIPYLKVAAPGLKELARHFDFELQVVAEDARPLTDLDLAGVRVRFIPWSERDEIAVLRQFDVGLMPLPDNGWTRFKCGLKLLQYMALGIPGVASPVGANVDIVRDGKSGFLAHTASQWVDCMTRLLRDSALRQKIGQEGRREVAARYSLDKAAPKLIRTLEEAAAGSAAQPVATGLPDDPHLTPRSRSGHRPRSTRDAGREAAALRT